MREEDQPAQAARTTGAADRRGARARRLGMAASVAVHLGLGGVLLLGLGRAANPPISEPWLPLPVSLVPAPEPEPAAPGPAGGAPAPAVTPARPKAQVRATPPPLDVAPIIAPVALEPMASVGEAELAGARTAGSGGGEGGGAGSGGGARCDMVERLQGALRRDPDVRTAAASAQRQVGAGRAVLVWDGDWVRDPGQSGKGLAGVRQAIALEVAFAPEACRSEPMRGLVLLSLGDGARLALGRREWRWTELLGARR